MSSASSLKRNMNKNKFKKIKSFLRFWKEEGKSSFNKKVPRQEEKRTCRHGPRLVVRARTAMLDEFPSVPKNVNCTPRKSGAEIKAGESKKTLGLEESSDADFTDSEFSSIESESDSETALESYH